MIKVSVGITLKGDEVTHSETSAHTVIGALSDAIRLIRNQMDSYPNQNDIMNWEGITITLDQGVRAISSPRKSFVKSVARLFTI